MPARIIPADMLQLAGLPLFRRGLLVQGRLARDGESVMDIATPSCYLMAGAAASAAPLHFALARRRPWLDAQRLFGVLCVLVVSFAYWHGQTLQASGIADMARALKLEQGTLCVFFMVFPWFIAAYTGRSSPALSIGFSVVFAELFLYNATQPYSLQYDTLDRIVQWPLPWGETVTAASGHNGPGFYVAAAAALAAFAYGLYALSRFYRAEHDRTVLLMTLSIALFLPVAVESMLVRKAVIHFIGLGPYAFFNLIAVMSVALAVESRKQLRASEARLRTIIEQSPVGITFIRDGCHVETNDAYLKMFGYSNLAEIVGTPMTDHIAPHLRSDVAERIQKRIEGAPTELTYETEGLRKDGSRIPIMISAKRVVLDGVPVSAGFITDLTERKEAEAALRDSAIALARQEYRLEGLKKQRDALVRKVHHRIKNNLQGVIGLLQQEMDRYPEAREAIAVAADKLYAIAAAHGLQTRALSEAVDLGELASMISETAACPVRLRNDLARPAALAQDEAVPIALVLNELLTNACKHRAPGAPVDLALDQHGSQIIIAVRNAYAQRERTSDGQHGLALVTALLPPESASLVVDDADNVFSVTLTLSPPATIPANEDREVKSKNGHHIAAG